MLRSIDGSPVLSSDDFAEYDFVSDGHRSLESSIADLGLHDIVATRREPPPSQAAKALFGTPALSTEDIQAYVQKSLGCATATRHNEDAHCRLVRVYVDGKFDPLNAGHALRLRQAKLAFPAVHLLVGVFRDDLCEQHGQKPRLPHVERCEVVRHCRWVDEVVEDAPWSIDEAFLHALRIDYVAIDEGASVDPIYERERVRGYDLVKSLSRSIPTRRTTGLTPLKSAPTSTPVANPSRDTGSNGTLRGKPAPEQDSENDPFSEPLIDLFQ